jgi:hypothetical protein
MGDPTHTPTSRAERIAKLADALREQIDQSSDHSARIGCYETADGTEREVAIVKTDAGEWEVQDRGPENCELIENLGRMLEEAIPLAIEYRRDCERRTIKARAVKLATAAARRRAALGRAA